MNDDLISRKAVLGLPRSITRNFFGEIVEESINVKEIEALPSAQLEPTLEQIEEYCHKRCLSIVDNALLHKYAQAETAKRIVGKSKDGMTLWYQCDMCNEPVDAQDNFCRGCGRRLIDE